VQITEDKEFHGSNEGTTLQAGPHGCAADVARTEGPDGTLNQ